MGRGLAFLMAVALPALLACEAALPDVLRVGPTNDADLAFVPAGATLPVLQSELTSDPTDDDSFKPAVSPSGGALIRRSTNSIVLRPPAPPQGPRRVGIQVGHWKTDEVPPELAKLLGQSGAIWDDVHEVNVNLDIATRVSALLRKEGVVVDLLPATVPTGYVADAFLALHADSDGVGELSGFKLARGPLRGPFEERLVSSVRNAYAKGTELDYDAGHIGVDMSYYYPFNWARFQHATSPHTPAAILEMGYLSSDDDRRLLVDEADRVASAIATGLLRFLADTPRSEIFRDDIVVPLPPPAAPSSTP